MIVEKTVNEEAVVISLEGQLEANSIQILTDLFDLDNLDNLERDVIIFDFTKASYISSAIIGWLAGFRSKLVAENKREPIISGCNDTIYNLFEITGVHRLFKWAD